MFQMGLVADIQYASNSDNTMTNSLDRLSEAVKIWEENKINLVINLGDTIDGGVDENESKNDMMRVTSMIPKHIHVEHVIGNHCLKNNKRETVRDLLSIVSDYRVINLSQDWKLIILDTTELSVCGGGYPKGTYQHSETEEFLKNNPKAVSYNGGVCSKQLQWLDDTLNEILNVEYAGDLLHRKKVMIAAHHPIGPLVPSHQAWNADSIVAVLNKYPSLVHTVFSGHYHEGGYVMLNGIHYLTLSSLMSSPGNSFSIMTINNNTLTIDGCGTEQHNYTLLPRPETLGREV